MFGFDVFADNAVARYGSNRYRDFEEVLSVVSVVPEGYVAVFTSYLQCFV